MRFLACVFVTLVLLLVGCEADVTTNNPPPVPDAGTTITPPRPINEPPDSVDPNDAPKPVITKLSPASAALGSIGPTIVVTGTGFVPRTVVRADGAELETSFESATQLSATLPTAKLADVGEIEISVGTSAPGGGESEELPFAIENPPPEIVGLEPRFVVAGAGNTKLTVTGTTFVRGSKIRFGATELVTTFKDSEHLEGMVAAASLGVSSTVPVTVVTPAPGGGTSTKIHFTIANGSSTVESLVPSSIVVGSPEFEIVVKGTGFAAGSAILFNGRKLTTTAGSAAGELKATVPADAIEFVGVFDVAVETPPPGGGLSLPQPFTVGNPVPVALSVDPPSVPAGSAATPVIVNGENFVNGSKISVANAPANTTFVSATQLKVTLTPAQLARVGTVALKVVTAEPGGGTTGEVLLQTPVTVPKITAVEPAKLFVGAPDTSVTIRGSFFVAGATVTARGQSIAQVTFPTPANGQSLGAVIPAALLAQPGPLPIVVTNPAMGGGASPPFEQVLVKCDDTPVGTVLENTSNIYQVDQLFAGAPEMTRWTANATCGNASSLSSVIAKQPGAYAIVQNGTPGPVALTAWADCTSDGKGAAFLTLYRRPTRPASDAERLQCEGVVADGSPHLSPDSGGSANCPGLTKANGGAITLAVCERAVVHIQTFDNASPILTPPQVLRIRAETP